MDQILTLIASPDWHGLQDSTLSAAREALRDIGADVGSPDWLAPGIACDLPFAMLADGQAEAAARSVLGNQPVDVVAQRVEHRRKRLLVADMDSTIVTGETLDELAAFAGIKGKVAAITARAMNGEIDFKGALRERVSLLAGLDASALEEAWKTVELTKGAKALVQTMRGNGAYAVLVSGGFKFFTSRVGKLCGFDVDLSNDLIVAEGKLTGAVQEPILDRDTKLKTLVRFAGERKIPLAASLAVGDGANDLDMIKAAGMGVAFRAKPIVAAEARMRIDHGDLTALLYAQGYRDSEIVS